MLKHLKRDLINAVKTLDLDVVETSAIMAIVTIIGITVWAFIAYTGS